MAILEVNNLKKGFGAVDVLKGVSFSLEQGQVLAIIGSSGSGKTTLLRCLNFLETPDEGEIRVNGELLTGANLSEAQIRRNRLHFGLVFQSFNLFPQYTVLETITLAPSLLEQTAPARIRQKAMDLLQQVVVADFPAKPEELAGAMAAIYTEYFDKAVMTAEDLEKTRQYAENVKRGELEKSVGSFADYLKQLAIVMERVDAEANIERLTQLVNKTNQFNLTTKRYAQAEMQQVLSDEKKRVYLYRVADRFGDNGIVAALIVDLHSTVPQIEEFVMSCRIMGKNIEDAIVEDVERDLQKTGYESLRGIYIPTAKNKPVAELYDRLGYGRLGEVSGEDAAGVLYEITLSEIAPREHFVRKL